MVLLNRVSPAKKLLECSYLLYDSLHANIIIMMATNNSVLLLLLAITSLSVASPLLSRESRQTESTAQPQFILFSNYTPDCETGLTEYGATIRVEYRLIDRTDLTLVGEWISANNVSLDILLGMSLTNFLKSIDLANWLCHLVSYSYSFVCYITFRI